LSEWKEEIVYFSFNYISANIKIIFLKKNFNDFKMLIIMKKKKLKIFDNKDDEMRL
jgi:hypothetical protein